MSADYFPPPASTFDIEVQGALGRFVVQPAGEPHSSVPVHYIQTHIGFAAHDSNQERLFRNLKPVREVFDLRQLAFSELMQRDIDDHRVAHSLIPYLISIQRGHTIKFFPPIVCCVVPTGPGRKILPAYPSKHESDDEPGPNPELKRSFFGLGFRDMRRSSLSTCGEALNT